MSGLQSRPTFEIQTELQPNEVLVRLRGIVELAPERFAGQFREGHGLLSIAKRERHFWSPWLHLDVRERSTESRQVAHVLFGRFSPHPTIWTGFMFSWLGLTVLTFFSAIFGCSQQLAGERPWGYWLIPAWILLAVTLWFAAQIGQRLAHVQLVELKQAVEESLESVAAGESRSD